MESKTLLDGRLHVLETLQFRTGEAAEVERALERIRPDVIAVDLTPDKLHEVIAHVKHGMGVKVDPLAEVWTNCLAAFSDVDPYAEYAAAVEHARERDLRVVALDLEGSEIGGRRKGRIEKDLEEHAIDATDLREVAMAFRGRLYELGVLDDLEEAEEEMSAMLWDVLQDGGTVAAVLHYPASEEILMRVRTRAEAEEAVG